MKYRKKSVVVEAEQFFTIGDAGINDAFDPDSSELCEHCGGYLKGHGRIDTSEGSLAVCPGDWIVTDPEGGRLPYKPDIFDLTYEPVTDADSALSQLDVARLRNLVEASIEALFRASQDITTALGILRTLQQELTSLESSNEQAPVLSDYRGS